jgi:hypothetical protein
VALVDVITGITGAVERALATCGPGERVTSAALENGPVGIVVYLGICPAAGDGGASGLARGRVLALNATTGAVLAVAPLAGRPSQLALAPGRSPVVSLPGEGYGLAVAEDWSTSRTQSAAQSGWYTSGAVAGTVRVGRPASAGALGGFAEP